LSRRNRRSNGARTAPDRNVSAPTGSRSSITIRSRRPASSLASRLTGHHPSLHGESQTDGLAKSADGDDMFWLAPGRGADDG
jgi:hypothetical protein